VLDSPTPVGIAASVAERTSIEVEWLSYSGPSYPTSHGKDSHPTAVFDSTPGALGRSQLMYL